jgi:hypothetical protein
MHIIQQFSTRAYSSSVVQLDEENFDRAKEFCTENFTFHNHPDVHPPDVDAYYGG